MLLEHRRPLVAYLLCAVLCAVVLITSMGEVERRTPDPGLTRLAERPVAGTVVAPAVVAATELGREVGVRTAQEVLVPGIAVITEAAGGTPWSIPAETAAAPQQGGAGQATDGPGSAPAADGGTGGSDAPAAGGGSGSGDGHSGSGPTGGDEPGGTVGSPDTSGAGGGATVGAGQPQGNAYGQQQGWQGGTQRDGSRAGGTTVHERGSHTEGPGGKAHGHDGGGPGNGHDPRGQGKAQGHDKAKGHGKSH